MNILLTGFTQRMVNSQKLRYDYLTSVYLLKDALRELGHTVAHRPVTYGEDLSCFDLALVGIGPPRSFTARHVIGSSWTVRTAKKVLFYCDDWSIANMGPSLKTTVNSYDKYRKWFTENLGQPMDDEEANSVYFMINDVLYRPPGFRLLAPMFPWGRHQTLLEDNLPYVKLLPWDPTSMVKELPFTRVVPENKQKRWVCATLQNHTDWVDDQHATWPVQWMGNRRKGEEYRPEEEVVQEYANSWGVLCPRYNRAGSGWWRVRYQWAAMTRSILRCDIKDSCYMGEEYRLPLRSVEMRDLLMLTDLARVQADWFYGHTDSKQVLLAKLQEAING